MFGRLFCGFSTFCRLFCRMFTDNPQMQIVLWIVQNIPETICKTVHRIALFCRQSANADCSTDIP